MKVDIAALNKFADTFGPAIAAIPAVIDAVSKSNDLERHIAMKQQELQKVMQDIEKAKAEGETFIKNTQIRADELIESANQFAKESQERIAAEKAKAKDALTVLNDQSVKAQAAVFAANQKRKEAEDEATKKIAELDAAHAAKVKQLESEIEDLEARHAKAEKSLATLRAKLEV
jgi:chromosome segregation ATPase